MKRQIWRNKSENYPRGVYIRLVTIWSISVHFMHFADIVRCVAFCIIIIIIINGFLMTQNQPLSASIIILENFIGHVCRTLSYSWYDVTIAQLYNLCDSEVFCALHDQLASLGSRHAQLTRCFSAEAELLVLSSCMLYRWVEPVGNDVTR